MSRFHKEVSRTEWFDITSDDEWDDAMTCPICGWDLNEKRMVILWANQHGWERRYFHCEDSHTHIRHLYKNGCLEFCRIRYEWTVQ